MKKVFVISLLVLALGFSLTACASGPKRVTLNVTTANNHYDSNIYTVPAGAEVTLSLTNNDSTEHEFAILKLGMHVTPPFGEKDEGSILWELDGVQPGTTQTATFTAPTEPGSYDVICGIPGHIELGMIATLIVK